MDESKAPDGAATGALGYNAEEESLMMAAAHSVSTSSQIQNDEDAVAKFHPDVLLHVVALLAGERLYTGLPTATDPPHPLNTTPENVSV